MKTATKLIQKKAIAKPIISKKVQQKAKNGKIVKTITTTS